MNPVLLARPGRRLCVWLALLFTIAAAAAQTTQYRISGKVVNAESGAPLARVEVAIVPVVDGMWPPPEEDGPRRGRRGRRPSGPSALDSVTTNEDGSFAFEHVPAGKYSLQGSRRGYITASYQEHGFYSTAIVTGPGLATENLTLQLSPGAVIGGSVIDAAGDPIEQAQVSIYRLNDDGLGAIRMYRSGNTDDLGAYEFAHLPPGTYFVSASARVWYAQQAAHQDASGAQPASATNLDVVYPRAFYADATDSGAATPIPVRGGEHLRIDLHMQAVPAVHLTYTVPRSGEGTAPNMRAWPRPPMVTQSVFGQMDGSFASSSTFLRGSDHGDSISVSVAPGEYQVQFEGRTLSVNAGGDTLLDPQAGTPAVEISGKIAAVAGATLPDSVDITLLPGDTHGNSPISSVAHDGLFHFDQVRPGAYEIEAHGEGRPMAIVQAATSGAHLEGHVLQVGTQSVALAATVAPASTIISGFARTSSAEGDQPASGVMIVLAPQHPGDHSLYRRDQSDSDGSFTLRQVAAGAYTLVAIRDGWDLEWARPEVIAHYLPGGQAVTVAAAGSGTIHLAKPAIVQAR